MLKNYFKLAYRSLLKNKLVASINILGLSVAVAAAITTFLYLQNEWSRDHFHENGERIFMLEYAVDYNEETQIVGNVPMPLGQALANDFPQVEQFARIDNWSSSVYVEDQVFYESVSFVDPSFFDLFSFPLDKGTPQVLNTPDAVIISTKLAEKYFQDQDPIDQDLTIVFSNKEKRIFTIKGVAAPFPDNAGLRFSIAAGMNAYSSLNGVKINDWGDHASGTFIQLQEAADADIIAAKMDNYVALQNEANENVKAKSFVLDNLVHPNPKAHEVVNRPSSVTHPLVVFLAALLAPLMMALSCFNYINISLGVAGKRLKEIGIRKVIGGKKMQLVGQFMTENLLLCFLALGFGLIFAHQALIPLFNASQSQQISLSLLGTPNLWLFLVALLAFVAVASGAYPAFYISAFQPTAIFKGSQTIIKKNKLTQLFLGIQFVLAFGIVITAVLLLSMGKKWMNLDWGYEPDSTFVVRLDNAEQYAILKNELEGIPYVQQVAGSTNHIGHLNQREQLKIGERVTEAIQFQVGADYLTAMGLQLHAGRFFDPNRPVADSQTVVVNQIFAEQQEWSNPIGKSLIRGDQRYKVIGVAKNFKTTGQSDQLAVTIFPSKEDAYNYLTIRHTAGAGDQVEKLVRDKWAALYPDVPLNCFPQALVFDGFYQSVASGYTNLSYIAGLALLIACMGLLGLSIQNYTRFLKEASIRKVFGASVGQVLLLANKNFILLLAIASGIATGLCWLGMETLLHTSREHLGDIQFGVMPYLCANLLVFLTACIAVSQQSYKIATVNPAISLKEE
ncbi:MAG: ABC transporter permease [Bacteroidota bacterium]